ncbi:MAG TPA: hydrogenase nickel incorporation protein HypA [Pyrodictiaceae archaeon]|nr:hydrogenase nickel incorporation protein HypA [Pyrodictiaceae archaeon]
MHEWALASTVLHFLFRELGCRKLEHVVIALGELQNIDWDVFRFALENIAKMEGFEIKRVEFVEKKAKFRCNRCGCEWRLDELGLSEEEREAIHFVPETVHAYVRCPKCGSRDFTVVEGRGVELVSFKGDGCNVSKLRS